MDKADASVSELMTRLQSIRNTRALITKLSNSLGRSPEVERQLMEQMSALKRMIEDAEKAAQSATKLAVQTEGSQTRLLTVQDMSRDLMRYAEEYEGLVRSVAQKRRNLGSNNTTARSTSPKTELQPLLNGPGSEGQAQSLGQQQQQQAQSSSVSLVQAQQMGQELEERARDIDHLVDTAVEVNQVAADIAYLIDSQENAVTQVAVNMEGISHHVDSGAQEVSRANARQRRYRVPCLGWLLMALGILAGVWLASLIS
eukprot:TRINITY_DN16358_c0_g1_i1.p1 TRINITY_DN16358_c0_g1~~TRINITY_DN16358_c0_g1_i1.p1  ORF type:complete len:257 (+),score=26.03 TRINITY_DN16358_c0_g1_i1:73-843(+)